MTSMISIICNHDYDLYALMSIRMHGTSGNLDCIKTFICNQDYHLSHARILVKSLCILKLINDS